MGRTMSSRIVPKDVDWNRGVKCNQLAVAKVNIYQKKEQFSDLPLVPSSSGRTTVVVPSLFAHMITV